MKKILSPLSMWGVCLLVSFSGALLADQQEVTELIVYFDQNISKNNNLDDVIQLINKGKDNKLKERLSHPIKARPLLHSYNRSSHKPQSITKDIQKSTKALLEKYIVLTYSGQGALKKAKGILEKDDSVLWFGENDPVTLSAVPNDPLFSMPPVQIGPAGGVREYQWALSSLNMPEVWEYSRGHAYLSMIDVSIDTTHPDLLANFRSHFSKDFAYGNDSVDTFDPEDKNQENSLTTSDIQNTGHGTHVAGILAAGSDNGRGVTGVCWHCSLMVGKLGYVHQANDTLGVHDYSRDRNLGKEDLINGIYYMIETGAQVINLSLHSTDPGSCKKYPAINDPFCQVLALADEMDVVIAAAAGNKGWEVEDDNWNVDFPANDYRVIAVGAVDSTGTVPAWSNKGPEIDLVTPGVDILSTFNKDMDWILKYPDIYKIPFSPNCGDSVSAESRYGNCSGTSMSTPYVSGIAAILRSTNPLLNKRQIKELLTSKARRPDNPDNAYDHDNAYGYGLPDTLASVKAALGTVNGVTLKNRLTPLFSFYSSAGQDHFYTTVPQMAMAALYEHLQPQPENGEVKWRSSGGSRTPGYYSFPRYSWMPSEPPMASVYIFTTHNNPVDPATELVPLYRLSRQVVNGSNQNNINHTYTTEQAGIDLFEGMHKGYKLDGIEGYIYPRTMPVQPAGTVKLYRKYNQARDDYAIFPESELSTMMAQGYTDNYGNDWIGYVYPNQDSDHDGLIDGFEEIIGTSNSNPDSDNDGISDGAEVNNYPYSDPMDTIPNPIAVETFLKESNPHWLATDFSEQFLDTTILFSQMQSFNGSDTASLRMRNLTSTGFEVLLEEEKSADTELGHANEVIGLLGLREGEILDSDGNTIGEAGLVTSNTSNGGDWKTLTFSRSYANPVLLMEMLTFNGEQPAHLRLKNVSNTGAQYQIEEWDYLDGAHASETIGYIVLEQGTQTLHDGHSIQVGVTAINHGWADVSFENMGGQPVVFSQSQTYNGGQAIVTRQREVLSNGFQVRLQEEEANDGAHAIETVGYIVIQ
jgi:serine protease